MKLTLLNFTQPQNQDEKKSMCMDTVIYMSMPMVCITIVIRGCLTKKGRSVSLQSNYRAGQRAEEGRAALEPFPTSPVEETEPLKEAVFPPLDHTNLTGMAFNAGPAKAC